MYVIKYKANKGIVLYYCIVLYCIVLYVARMCYLRYAAAVFSVHSSAADLL